MNILINSYKKMLHKILIWFRINIVKHISKSNLLAPLLLVRNTSSIRYILFFLIFFITPRSFSQMLSTMASTTYSTYATAGTYTFTVPACVTSIDVECWGAGGGGGGNNSQDNGAPGGGGGAYSKKTIAVTAGQTYTVFVGTGGSGGIQSSTSTANGGTGGDSWFSPGAVGAATVLAKGGVGGVGAFNGQLQAGGAGGSSASGIGTVKYSGGDGGQGNGTGGWNFGGGGGSSAGRGSVGNNGKYGYGNSTSGNGAFNSLPAGGAAPGGGVSGGYGGSEGDDAGPPAAGTAGDGNAQAQSRYRRRRDGIRQRLAGASGRRRLPRSEQPRKLGQGRPQRGLPVRIRQEVQALPRPVRLENDFDGSGIPSV